MAQASGMRVAMLFALPIAGVLFLLKSPDALDRFGVTLDGAGPSAPADSALASNGGASTDRAPADRAASERRIAAIPLSPDMRQEAELRARTTLELPLAELDRRKAGATRDIVFWAPVRVGGRAVDAMLGHCERAGAEALDCRAWGVAEPLGPAEGALRRVPLADVADWSFARAGLWEGAFRLRAKMPYMTAADRAAVAERLAPDPGAPPAGVSVILSDDAPLPRFRADPLPAPAR